MTIYHKNRRARKKGAEGKFTPDDVIKLIEQQKNRCYYCKCEGKKLTVDHKTPISRCGSNQLENLCMACGSCNSQKGNKTEEEYWEYRKKRGL